MRTRKGERFGRFASQFRRPLRKWMSLIQDWSLQDESDPIYWYNEIANVSLLAGAMWATKNIALMEYENRRRAKTRPGRFDLLFETSRTSFLCESKLAWTRMENKRIAPKSKIKTRLSEARLKARTFLDSSCDHKMGLAFAIPSIPTSLRGEVSAYRSEFVRVLDEIECDFFAYVLPGFTRPPTDGGRIYPGIALIGREAN